MKHVVIVGAGGAGLCMLEQLLLASTTPLRVTLVDPDPESYRERTWCQWLPTEELKPYQSTHWSRICVATPKLSLTLTPKKVVYAYASGVDYRTYVTGLNDGRHQIEWIRQAVTRFGYDGPGHAHVYLGRKRLTCDWIFTSWYPGNRVRVNLWQHFHGWMIETIHPVFESDTMTLMDFDVPQHPDGVVFAYVLPFNPNEALVELTCFSPSPWPEEMYKTRLIDHIRERYRLEPEMYRIRSVENGKIPMDAIRFPGQPNPATFPIGTVAGAVKPTSGYAFTRMQLTCRHLAKTLLNDGRPAYPAAPSARFAFYDHLLLQIFRTWPEASIPIFQSLFSKIPVDLVFRFLDEKTTLMQEIGIFRRLPLRPFLKSLWRHVTS